ncbi:uncharacterized protein BX663DRAFT_552319 [Cokeromyces recurvatus]|uniref:uncharacterized protein n=1 Tax=Cokeromyces recurvatus TaxID=90255 RepID=UPI00221EAAA0|nr:uncharacterized protein BX663DRAFT_552319 [Cokeromyces recurvatus]KAI7902396.1 hypothetical protein BX663DRAFT_552319 [Cokeromyces recurvatus]
MSEVASAYPLADKVYSWSLMLSTVIIIIIAIPAMALSHKSAYWVFIEFQNSTGVCKNDGMVFLIGLLSTGMGISSRMRCSKSLGLILSTLFSIQDVDELLNSTMPTGTFFLKELPTVKALQLFFFLVILLIAQIGSLCNFVLAAREFYVGVYQGMVYYHPLSSFTKFLVMASPSGVY